jgi:hypothetical protein
MNGYTGKFRLYKLSDFNKLPAMRWAVKPLIVKDGINVLFGEAKIGKKSFTGISIACAVATGREWAKAFPTEQMPVLYVAAEDFHGLLRRQAAWEKLNDAVCGDNLQFVKVPINLFNEVDVTQALAALKDQGFNPGFVVIDTLQRSMSGGSENDTKDMSRVFELAELLRSELSGATILIIHHTTKDGLNYRGSSVISGSANGLIQAVSKDLTITLNCHGFKDAAPFEEFAVRLESVMVETEVGMESYIAVTELITGSAIQKQQTKDERDIDTMTLCLRMTPLNNKATYTEWHEQVHDYTSKKVVDKDGTLRVIKEGWSEKTFNRKLELMKEKFGARLVKRGDGQGAIYTLLLAKDAQPEANQRTTANPETVSPKALSRHPLKGDDSDDSGFGGPSSTVNYCHDGGDSGSRETRTGENLVESELEKAARDQLNATKH